MAPCGKRRLRDMYEEHVEPGPVAPDLDILAEGADDEAAEAAKALARRMIGSAPTDDARITHGFRLCVARSPSPAERSALLKLLNQAKSYYEQNAPEAKTFAGNPEASAWAATARVLLNLDEFITRE